jgi:hypothetical protein
MKIVEITTDEFIQSGLNTGSIAHAVRDVDLGMGGMYQKINRQGIRRLNKKLDNQEWTIVDLPIRKLTAIQPNVNLDFRDAAAKKRAETTDDFVYPCVVRFENNYFIFDGHHRVADAAAAGAQTIRCRLVDMNEPGNTNQMSLSV